MNIHHRRDERLGFVKNFFLYFKVLYANVFFKVAKKPIQVKNKFSWIFPPLDPIENVFVKDGTNLPRHLRLLPFFTALAVVSSFIVGICLIYGIQYVNRLVNQPSSALFLDSTYSYIKTSLPLYSVQDNAFLYISALQHDPSKIFSMRYDSIRVLLTEITTYDPFEDKTTSFKEKKDIAEQLRNPEMLPINSLGFEIDGTIFLGNSMISFPIIVNITISLKSSNDIFERLLHGKGCPFSLKAKFHIGIFDLFSIPIYREKSFFIPSNVDDNDAGDLFSLHGGINEAFQNWLHLQKLSLSEIADSTFSFSLGQQHISEQIPTNITISFPPFQIDTMISTKWNNQPDYVAAKTTINSFSLQGVFKNRYFYFLKDSNAIQLNVDFISLENFSKTATICTSQHFLYYFLSSNETDHTIVHFLCRFLSEKFRPFDDGSFSNTDIPLRNDLQIRSEQSFVEFLLSTRLPTLPSSSSSVRFIQIEMDEISLQLNVENSFFAGMDFKMDGFLFPIDAAAKENEVFSYETLQFYMKLYICNQEKSPLISSTWMIEKWVNNMYNFMMEPNCPSISLEYSWNFVHCDIPKSITGTFDVASTKKSLHYFHDAYFTSISYRHDHLLDISFVADKQTTNIVIPLNCFSDPNHNFTQDSLFLNEQSPIKQIVVRLNQDFIFCRMIKALSYRLARNFPLPNSQIPRYSTLTISSNSTFFLNTSLNDIPLVTLKAKMMPLNYTFDFSQQPHNEHSTLTLIADIYLKKSIKESLSVFNSFRARPNFEFYQNYYGGMDKDEISFKHEAIYPTVYSMISTNSLDQKLSSLGMSILTYFVEPIELPDMTGILASTMTSIIPRDDFSLLNYTTVPYTSSDKFRLRARLRVPLDKETFAINFWRGCVLEIIHDASYMENSFQANDVTFQIFINRKSSLFTIKDSLESIAMGCKRKYSWFPFEIMFKGKGTSQLTKMGGCFFKGFGFKGLWKLTIVNEIPYFCKDSSTISSLKEAEKIKEFATSVIAPIYIKQSDTVTFNDVSDTARDPNTSTSDLRQLNLFSIDICFFNSFRIYQLGVSFSKFHLMIHRKLISDKSDSTILQPQIDLQSSPSSKANTGHKGLNSMYQYFKAVHLTAPLSQHLLKLIQLFQIQRHPYIQKFMPNSHLTVSFNNPILSTGKYMPFDIIIDMGDSEPSEENGYKNPALFAMNIKNTLLVFNLKGEFRFLFRDSLFNPVKVLYPTYQYEITLLHIESKAQTNQFGSFKLTQNDCKLMLEESKNVLFKYKHRYKIIANDINKFSFEGLYEIELLNSFNFQPGLYEITLRYPVKNSIVSSEEMKFYYYHRKKHE